MPEKELPNWLSQIFQRLMKLVEDLGNSERGKSGFGSSGSI